MAKRNSRLRTHIVGGTCINLDTLLERINNFLSKQNLKPEDVSVDVVDVGDYDTVYDLVFRYYTPETDEELEFREQAEKIRLQSRREQYERLKAEFENKDH